MQKTLGSSRLPVMRAHARRDQEVGQDLIRRFVWQPACARRTIDEENEADGDAPFVTQWKMN
jgi:hypothetical protein